tara:strand:+ start:284 stop:484 length:201 start_codon:yes stop_codon:yes gene_type:complete
LVQPLVIFAQQLRQTVRLDLMVAVFPHDANLKKSFRFVVQCCCGVDEIQKYLEYQKKTFDPKIQSK